MSSINPKIAILRAAWVNEKCAPDILQYAPEAHELAQAVIEQQRQVDLLNDESSPAISLYQQDIERVRFLLASYARVRLRKVCVNV